MPSPFARVAVIGTGLIGGSFALAVRSAVPGIRITGWDRLDVLRRAVASGVVDEGQAELPNAVAGADLIFVALPVGVTIERMPEIARHAASGALVTDAASTKRAVCANAERCFGKGARFLGGHPMAGKEDSGMEAAEATLFRGARYALIGAGDKPGENDSRITNFISIIEAIGAQPVWMDAATHDRAAAIVSHLPQLLAVALAGVAREATEHEADREGELDGFPLTLAGRGLRDALRLAGSPYGVWRDIVLTNTDNLDAALSRMAQAIEHLRANLRQRELEKEFAVANEVYRILHGLR